MSQDTRAPKPAAPPQEGPQPADPVASSTPGSTAGEGTPVTDPFLPPLPGRAAPTPSPRDGTESRTDPSASSPSGPPSGWEVDHRELPPEDLEGSLHPASYPPVSVTFSSPDADVPPAHPQEPEARAPRLEAAAGARLDWNARPPEDPPAPLGQIPALSALGPPPPGWRRKSLQFSERLLKEYLLNNLLLKLLAVAVAVALWSTVSQDQSVSESTEIVLDIRRPTTLVLVNQPPESVAVELVGPPSRLRELRTRRLELTVDLTRARPGELLYTFAGHRVRNLPPGVEIVSYSPASTRFELDELTTRRLPVRAAVEGDPATGLKLASVKVEPTSVTLEGPKSRLKNLREVNTEPIPLGELKRSREVRIPLALRSPQVRVKEGSEEITVNIELEPVLIQRSFDAVEVQVSDSLSRFEVSPITAKVVLEGPYPQLQSTDIADIQIQVEPPSKADVELSGTYSLRFPAGDSETEPRLRVTWPHEEEVHLKRLIPSRFQLRPLKGSPEGTPDARERKSRRGTGG